MRIVTGVKSKIDQESVKPTGYSTEDGKVQLAKLVTNIDYADYTKRLEKLDDLLETLDGKLSLKNATIVISI